MRAGTPWTHTQDFTALVECRLHNGETQTLSFADAYHAQQFVGNLPAWQASAEPDAEILDVVATRIVTGLWGAN